jgi:DNA-binding NarL/FixJ family response regulator
MIQLGAKGYMTKNSSKEEMVEAIVAVMEGSIYVCREMKDKMPPEGI